jgi:RHS repeat-associated protein
VARGLPLLLQDGSAYYLSGPGGLPLEQISGTTVTYFHHDQLGSTRLLTNSSGASVGTASYDAYGNMTATGTTTPFGYAGQYTDVESGLVYLRARYYDPATAQFLSRDPAVMTTREPYAYTRDNPLNAADPTGLYFVGVEGGASAELGIGVGAGGSCTGDLDIGFSGVVPTGSNALTGTCAGAGLGEPQPKGADPFVLGGGFGGGGGVTISTASNLQQLGGHCRLFAARILWFGISVTVGSSISASVTVNAGPALALVSYEEDVHVVDLHSNGTTIDPRGAL